MSDTIQFRPFADSDHLAFAGTETYDPRIAEMSWGFVIVDGCTVQAHLSDDFGGESFGLVLPGPVAALAYGKIIVDHLRGTYPGDIGSYLEEL